MAIIPPGAGPCINCGCAQQPGPWVAKGDAICRCTGREKWLARQRAAQAPSYGERFRGEMATLRAGRELDEAALRHRLGCRVALKWTAKSLIR